MCSVSDRVGLLVNRPPASSGLPFVQSSDVGRVIVHALAYLTHCTPDGGQNTWIPEKSRSAVVSRSTIGCPSGIRVGGFPAWAGRWAAPSHRSRRTIRQGPRPHKRWHRSLHYSEFVLASRITAPTIHLKRTANQTTAAPVSDDLAKDGPAWPGSPLKSKPT
jgi:hypothetical protein